MEEMTKSMQMGMDIIMHAGDAKSMALNAISLAENKKIEEARENLKEAQKNIVSAHGIHSDLLTRTANGEIVQMDLILTHALDHLTSAEIICLLADKFISLYQKL